MLSSLQKISVVSAEQVYPLRLKVLRPGGVLADCIWPGDDLQNTVHMGAMDDAGNVLGVASFFEQNHPDLAALRPIQLRGMATHPDARGKGYGKALVIHAMEEYSLNGADLMWCNAREVAVSFYQNLGFQITGEPFNIGTIGKHWVMFIRLND